jgi:ferredoxin
VEPLDAFPADVVGRLRQMHRVAAEPEPFAEAEPILQEDDARREGGRCLGCLVGAVVDETKCAVCLTCLRACPLDALEIGDAAVANAVRCQACGVCASVCPANAISLSYWAFEDLSVEDLGQLRPARQGATVALACEYAGDQHAAPAEALRVPCLARLKAIQLLRLVRRGYRRILLHPCAKEDCKYGSAWENIESVAGYVQGLLQQCCPEARVEVCLPEAAEQTRGGPAGDER